MSAPYFLMTSSGATVFPRLFDIALPWPSSTKPCVSTASYGAPPRMATPVRSDEWNQPRCWSEPSR